MKYTKYFAGFALAVGLLAAGTSTASAQDYYGRSFRRAVGQRFRLPYFSVILIFRNITT